MRSRSTPGSHGPRRSARAAGWILAALAAFAGVPSTGWARSKPKSDIDRAIKYFDDLKDEKAEALLQKVLASSPPPETAAKAHLYLGLIELNARRNPEALEEFKQALALDATVRPPAGSSPIVRETFSRAQGTPPPAAPETHPSASEGAVVQAAPPPAATPETPTATHAGPADSAPTATATATATRRRSKVPAVILGSVAVAALAGGVVFGLSSNSQLSQAQAATTLASSNSLAQQSGQSGLIADVCFGVSAVSAITAGILLIRSFGSDAVPEAPAPPPAVAWGIGPRGGTVSLRF